MVYSIDWMNAAAVSEYEAFLLVEGESDYASIDWRSESRNDDVFQAETYTLIETSPWLLDSCASVGITHSRADFANLVPLKTPRVVRGLGGSTITAMGVGSVLVPTGKGTKLRLDPVLFIPHSNVHLISVPNLDRAGYTTTFGGQRTLLHRHSLLLRAPCSHPVTYTA